ncbi:60S ribosomal L40 [Cordyceps militaris]|uniref:60S ribosomal L40 n=1 Tax=Cordyceps militaris TaxID=73501 RepID=A0A2H4SUR8_CORMI|nr:60S ribosomal L40 [Cordyceps militaris]
MTWAVRLHSITAVPAAFLEELGYEGLETEISGHCDDSRRSLPDCDWLKDWQFYFTERAFGHTAQRQSRHTETPSIALYTTGRQNQWIYVGLLLTMRSSTGVGNRLCTWSAAPVQTVRGVSKAISNCQERANPRWKGNHSLLVNNCPARTVDQSFAVRKNRIHFNHGNLSHHNRPTTINQHHHPHSTPVQRNMSLAGRVIIITGGSNGIGKACVERFGRDGASVVINYYSDEAGANALVSSIGKDRAVAVKADAGTMDGITKLIDETVEKFGHIDVVMANAAMMMMRNVENTTEKDFDSMFNLNVKGPYFLAQKAVPHIRDGGSIIFVSTGICHHSLVLPDYLLYASTKGAIEQMTRVMSKGLAAKGITVNAVGPGPTATELFFKGKSEAQIDALKKMSPFGRFGKPAEVANMVAFLAGPDSRWVSGQTYLVNGGTMV